MLNSNLLNNLQNNMALMQQFQQLMGGKNTAQQLATLINIAQNKGIDINQKCFTKDDLRQLGLNL